MKIKLLTTIGIFAILFSCKEKEIELNGQVFIVTQGGQSIPLGLVSIGLMDFELANEVLKERFSDFETEISELENAITNAKNELEGEFILKNSLWNDVLLEAKTKSTASFAQKGVDYALLDAKPLYNQFKSFINLDENIRDQQLQTKGGENLSARYNLKTLIDYDLQRKKILNLYSDYNLLVNELEEFKKGYSILPPLEERFLKTKTNSQGDFQIKLPKGKYFIFASGSRIIGTDKENYMWAQTLDLTKDINDFFFSNDNLVSIEEIKSIK